jgi:lysophospholipase L1-like esterase
VRKELDGIAEIWAPDGNCMHSVHHVFNLAWYVDGPADVIHFNFGLWDCRRLGKGSEENAVPVEQFTRNLDFILGKVREGTSATLIWATLTPVVEERYNARFSRQQDPYRVAADVDRYNAAAAPVLRKHGITVNDLNGFVKENGVENMISEDGIHYTKEAQRLLGVRVAAEIRRAFGT